MRSQVMGCEEARARNDRHSAGVRDRLQRWCPRSRKPLAESVFRTVTLAAPPCGQHGLRHSRHVVGDVKPCWLQLGEVTKADMRVWLDDLSLEIEVAQEQPIHLAKGRVLRGPWQVSYRGSALAMREWFSSHSRVMGGAIADEANGGGGPRCARCTLPGSIVGAGRIASVPSPTAAAIACGRRTRSAPSRARLTHGSIRRARGRAGIPRRRRPAGRARRSTRQRRQADPRGARDRRRDPAGMVSGRSTGSGSKHAGRGQREASRI